MTIEQTLLKRSDSKCELCASDSNLSVYELPPVTTPDSDKSVMVCDTCRGQIEKTADMNANHWRCLNDSMWSQVPAVQVVAWRLLKRLSVEESWAQDLLDMLYLDEDVQQWAEAGAGEEEEATAPTLDCNGTVLENGDSVTIIKDLVVKGANFTAKRGTTVRKISLTSNPEHIEGRVNGTRIVLLSCYLKKLS